MLYKLLEGTISEQMVSFDNDIRLFKVSNRLNRDLIRI